jgi:hypothetical protein
VDWWFVKWVWFPHNILIYIVWKLNSLHLTTSPHTNILCGNQTHFTKPPVHILLHCVVTKLTSLNDQFHILIYCVETWFVKWVWLPHNIIICGMVVCEVSLVSTQYNNMWTGGLVKWVETKLTSLNHQSTYYYIVW